MQVTGTPGEIYEQHMVPAIFTHWAPDLVEAAGVRSGERVLDLACGTGVVARLVVKRVGPSGRAVGLDLNPGMLAAARAASAGESIEWLEGSATQMPVPVGAFDAVVCQQGFQFFPDRPAALREVRRVLAPGGRLALAVWRSIEHSPGFRVLEEALARRIGAARAALPPFGLGDGQAVRALLVDAGFRDVRLRADVKLSRWRSAEHMVRSVVGGAPTMLGALAEQGPGVLDAIVTEVTAATRGYVDDDGWATPQATNVLTARV